MVVAAVLCVLDLARRRTPRGAPPARTAAAARDDHELARSLGIPSRRVESLALAGGDRRRWRAPGSRCCSASRRPRTSSPLLALQLFAAALAATRSPLLGVAVIVALPHVADWLTALLLLAAVALRRPGDAEPAWGSRSRRASCRRTAEGLHAHGLRRHAGRPPRSSAGSTSTSSPGRSTR